MDLVISGIALSYQWCPSLKRFEENLVGKKASGPSLVEHAGEIIYQAVQDAGLDQGSHIAILLDTGKVELGHYLPLLQREFKSIELIDPSSKYLGDHIDQAMGLINDQANIHIVLCDISSSGTAALVLSPPDHSGRKITKLIAGINPQANPSRADYIEISGAALASAEIIVEDLQKAYSSWGSSYPVAVGHFKTPGSRSVEILNLIQAVLSVKIKYIPPSKLLSASIPLGLNKEPFYINQEHRPWLSRGSKFNRSAILICADQKNSVRTFLLEEEKPIQQKVYIRVAPGTDPYLLLINGDDETELTGNLNKMESRLNSSGSLLKLS